MFSSGLPFSSYIFLWTLILVYSIIFRFLFLLTNDSAFGILQIQNFTSILGDSIDDYLGQQGFEYDSDEMMYFHPTKKTIMSKEWVDRNPRKAEEEAMAINQVPKLYVNKLTNHKMKELVKTYYPSY